VGAAQLDATMKIVFDKSVNRIILYIMGKING
jgi:hypothetical protein